MLASFFAFLARRVLAELALSHGGRMHKVIMLLCRSTATAQNVFAAKWNVFFLSFFTEKVWLREKSSSV